MTNKPYQRKNSRSNAHVGKKFEVSAQKLFAKKGVEMELNFKVRVGVGKIKKEHAFDLGSSEPKILIECKSHKWTSGGNAPSAKMTVWNEAMYYFKIAPHGYKKIMFVLRHDSSKRKKTLAEYYIGRYNHLIPKDVEIWEYDERTKKVSKLIHNKS